MAGYLLVSALDTHKTHKGQIVAFRSTPFSGKMEGPPNFVQIAVNAPPRDVEAFCEKIGVEDNDKPCKCRFDFSPAQVDEALANAGFLQLSRKQARSKVRDVLK